MDTYEEKIKIINTTNLPLNNIQLILENLNINISQYKVVRQRGSLTFLPPQNLIQLGNLVPDESAEIYFTLPFDVTLPTSPLLPLEDIQISYTLDNNEIILSNLDNFLKLHIK